MYQNKKFWLAIIITFTVLNFLVIFFYQPLSDFGKKILTRQPVWYAVHLTNGHVYFGELKSVTPETIKLASTYYLEAYTTQPQTMQGEGVQVQTTPQTTYNLIKRGSVKFMSTDNVLFINRSVVLFWEKLTPSSDIVSWIEKSESGKQ